MKKEYEKPILEISTFEIEVSADGSGYESVLDIGGWWT